jgi:hypothetical protein
MSGTRRKPGRLGPYVEGYRARLLELGYTPGTVRGMLKVLGQLGRWMESAGVEAGQSTRPRSVRFSPPGAPAAIGTSRPRAPWARWCATCARSARWRPRPRER